MKNTWAWMILFPLLLAQSVSASAEPRLIETSAHQRAWMNEQEILELARLSHSQGHCGGFIDVTDHQDKHPMFNKQLGIFEERTPHHSTQVNALIAELTNANIMAQVEHLSRFPNRFYRASNGADAAKWIQSEFIRLSQGRTDVTTELFKHRKFTQPSVIVRIAGKGPHASEHVVLGAHEDSVNWSSGMPDVGDSAPGADDDASGVATLLETFRVLMASGYQPDRTLEFMTYAGEELGLLGSQDIAAQYKKDGVNVVGVFQLDMTLFPGPDAKIHMISDNTDKAMTHFTEMLIDSYVQIPWVEMPCGYGCSDHASWNAVGYPSAFPFEADMEEHNPRIHTERDTMDILTPSFGLHFAKLAIAYAVEMASD